MDNYQKISYLIITISLICVLFFSCNKESAPDCFQTTGAITTETRQLNSFTKIQLEDNINLILTQDSLNQVSIEGGENLLPEITTKIVDETLIIRNDNSCNWVRRYDIPIDVYVSVKNLTQISIYGYGTISNTDTLYADTLKLDGWDSSSKINLNINVTDAQFRLHTGPMDLTLKGQANSCYIYAAGYAIANSMELEVSAIHVNSSGTGDFYILASQKLSAEIRSFGNVYYQGSPLQIDTAIVGEGKLIKIN